MVKKLKRSFKNIAITFLVLFLSFAVTQVWAPWKINPFTGKLDYYSLDVGGELSGEAAGDVLYYDGTNWTNLATGTAGQAFIAGTTPSWGTLGATYGGTGQDSSGWTGVPVVAAGTWANSAQLITGYGGTGQDSSGWTGYPYVTAGTWAADTMLTKTATGIQIGTGAVGVDYTIDFDGQDNDGQILWDEDNDRFTMSCDLEVTENLYAATYGSDSSVSNAELLYINSLSSNAQTQISGKQPLDADLTAIAALASTDSNVIVGSPAGWVAESGATARASLGLTIGTNVQAYDADLAALAGGTLQNVSTIDATSETAIEGAIDTLTLSGTSGLTIGSSIPFLDAPLGTLTLQQVDALDATTEGTIETNIDTLSNLTSIGTIATGIWQGTAIANTYVAGLDQNCLTTSDPTFDDLVIDKIEANECFTFDAVQTATGDGDTTIAWGSGNVMYFTFGASNEIIRFTAPPGVARVIMVIKQDGVGSRTIDWSNVANLLWPGNVEPTLSTTAAYVDIITFLYDGTSWFGLFNGDFR